MAGSVGEAWQRIATQLAPRLSGTWVVRRRGARTTLVREPIEWTLPPWIGFGPSRASDWGRVHAAVVPLVEPFNWYLTYGLTMGDRPADRDVPGSLRPLDPDAVDVVDRFLQRQGLPAIDGWPDTRFPDIAERSYARPAGERDRPVAHWTQLSGWRVVTGTGSPVEPARDAIAYWQRFVDTDAQVEWFGQLIAAWESGGRASALDFLVEYKQQVLTREKLVG